MSLASAGSLDPSATALIAIDVIHADAHPDYGMGRVAREEGRSNAYYFDRVERVVVPNLRRLLMFFREHRLPVVHVRVRGDDDTAADWSPNSRLHIVRRGVMPCQPGMREYDWLDGVGPEPGEVVVEKRSVSAFTTTGLEGLLRGMGVSKIVFTGVATHLGVGAAAIDATDRGFSVTVVDDATATFSQDLHDEWLRRNAPVYIRALEAVAVMRELRRGAAA